MTNKETDSAYFFTVKPTLVKQLPPFHFKVMASSYTSKDEVLVFLYCPAIDHYALPGFFYYYSYNAICCYFQIVLCKVSLKSQYCNSGHRPKMA